MNVFQHKAIEGLERAFKRCREVGLMAVGIDDSFVVAVRSKELEHEACRTSACEAVLKKLNAKDNAVAVETCRFYLDSGGQ